MAKRKTKRSRILWANDEIKHLKRIFRNMSTEDAAKELGRSVTSVQAKAFTLGLRKTRKYLKSIGKA